MKRDLKKAIAKGADTKLRSQVEKKCAKGYSIAEIADMLEETEETIMKMIRTVVVK